MNIIKAPKRWLSSSLTSAVERFVQHEVLKFTAEPEKKKKRKKEQSHDKAWSLRIMVLPLDRLGCHLSAFKTIE